MASGHVPAWKRLGLKLKYASENASASIDKSDGHDGGQKRKSTLESNSTTALEPPAKKLRVDISNRKQDDIAAIPSITPSKQSVTPNRKSKPETTRRKSVAFAADTKGDDHNPTQKTLTSAIGSPGSTPKKSKKEKRAKNEKGPSTTQAPFERRSPILEYLHEYAHARESWKFNKNREVKVLKQMFSSDEIPNSYQPALASYIYGLKSSGAKQRLIKDCQEQSAEDESPSTSTTVKPKDVVFRARFVEDLRLDNLISAMNGDDQYQTWIENEPRSRLLLTVLGQTTTIPDPQPPSMAANSQATQPKVKKSKARTSRVEIVSDSDSSSSDSNNDSDSDQGSDRKLNPEKAEVEVDTSSSGSSSSDSDADSSSSSEGAESDADSSSDTDTSSEAVKKPTTNGVHDESSSDDDSD